MSFWVGVRRGLTRASSLRPHREAGPERGDDRAENELGHAEGSVPPAGDEEDLEASATDDGKDDVHEHAKHRAPLACTDVCYFYSFMLRRYCQ